MRENSRKYLRKTGGDYEQIAACFLEEQGYRILGRNIYCRYGELDIVALDGAAIVFVEVKYRKSAAYGMPEEAVTLKKQRAIAVSAKWYLLKNGYGEDVPCRFDVVAILDGSIRHIKNAFTCG